jgi:hypothetical protein
MAEPFILVLVTVLASSSGIASDTRFQEFNSKAACDAARDGIEAGVQALDGTLGRDVFAACYSKT